MKNREARVLIFNCDYSAEKIARCIRTGLAAFGLQPGGKIFIKPNAVFVHKKEIFGEESYTHPAVLEGALQVFSRLDNASRIYIGEKSAIGLPTRLAYKYAGYHQLVKRIKKTTNTPVDLYCIEEDLRAERFVGGVVHSVVRISKRMAESDFMVYLPKLKRHCVSNMTDAVKLNIGILSDDERSIRHDFLLNEKIADLLSVGYPDFIVMDAITIGAGNEAVPAPRHLGVLIMGVNPVAVDLVAAHLMGYTADDIDYLKAAIKRGYGPARVEEVEINGDYSNLDELEPLRERLKPYDEEWHRWDDVERELKRANSPINFYFGPSTHNSEKSQRCEYGCVMGVKMAFASLERYAGTDALKNARGITIIIGQQGAAPIDCGGEVAMFIGACSRANIVNAKKIVRLNKCFTTATDMIPLIGFYAKIPTPYTDVKMLPGFIWSFLLSAMKKLFGGRYLQDILFFIKRNLIRKL